MNYTDKEYRTKLYHENKGEYKKIKKEFVYGVSQNFRNKKNDKKRAMKQLEAETMQAYEEDYDNGYRY